MRIFISYGHDEHLEFARRLAKELRDQSYEVWFDEDFLKGGVLWEEYIEKGLRWVAEDKNGRMILVMTPHSVRRPDGYCLNELSYALDLHLPVLPIMLVWVTPPLSIYRYQWLDMTQSNNGTTSFESDFNRIIEAIEKEDYYEDENRSRLERLLEPLDFSADIKYYLPSFIGREWFFEELDKWINDKGASRIFLLTGLPGIGKTAIAIKMIQTYNCVAAYHLIRRGDSEKTSLRRAICSIAFQLSKQLPDYFELLARADVSTELNRCNDSALFDVLISAPLMACQSRISPVVIVFDALDESVNEGFSVFAQFLSSIVRKLPEWIRIIITSRPENAVLLPFQAYRPHILEPRTEENNNDVQVYIEKRLKENFGDDCTIDSRPILKKSEGIFLYAKYVCDELLPKYEENFAPGNLPAGIGAVYYEFFSRTYPDINTYRKRIRPILEVLLAQVEPFAEDHLADCLGVDEDEIYDFLTVFQTFFSIDGNRKIRPFHTSLYDWLAERAVSGPYAVKRGNGTVLIADWLQKKFDESGYNFFNDSPMGILLETWFPEILERTNHLHFDVRNVLAAYIKQVCDKSILQDLVSNRRCFHFIKSILLYVFRQQDFNAVMIEEEISRSGLDIGRHVKGLEYLYEHSKSGKFDLPPKGAGQPEYYYYLDIRLPMFYVQSSFDPHYTFQTLSYGLKTVYDDGRLSNVYHLLSEIYNLATNAFSDCAPVAVKYLMEVADYVESEGDWDGFSEKIRNCAKSIQKKYNYGELL